MSKEALEQSRITIKVLEKAYFKDAMLGQFEFDFNHLYFMENHTWPHFWVALTNPESEDYSEINGYLKMSASCYGADDAPTELKEDENDEDGEIQIPSSVKPKFKQIKLHAIMGENLPRLDAALIGKGKMDAFLKTKINGKEIKTTAITTKDDKATWEETFFIPVRVPVLSGKLVLGVWDYDFDGDDQAGSLIFDINELLEMKQKTFFWKNIFGSPGQEEVKLFESAASKRAADEMNENPEKATKWKGRILFAVEHEDQDKPILKTEAIKKPSYEEREEAKRQWKAIKDDLPTSGNPSQVDKFI